MCMPGLLYQMICLTNLPHSSIKLFDVAISSPSQTPFFPLTNRFQGTISKHVIGVCLFIFIFSLYYTTMMMWSPICVWKMSCWRIFNLFSYHGADMSWEIQNSLLIWLMVWRFYIENKCSMVLVLVGKPLFRIVKF